MKRLLLIILLGATSVWAYSQDSKGIIQGTLVDSASKKPLSYATVSVFKASDTSLITYRLSDEKGSFKVPQLPFGIKLRVIVTFTGYRVFRQEFRLSADRSLLDVNQIALAPSSLTLDEVVVRAERPPVTVRKDTIEFNAAAFKTLPDALVEDLLRKLPGVNVDKDGNILVNGRKVSTIYVDGREFFGGDIKMASRNLPANIIDKVQVNNDPEALKFNPFLADADIPQVVNLKLKPGIKKGIFGKIYGGGGIKEKGEFGGLLNLFRDTTQVSILGYGNNLNKSSFSFTDLRSVGGFGRSGWGNANGNGNGGLNIDRVSFGGSGLGLMKSWGGGFNFNTVVRKKVPFSFNYFYGAVTSDYDELRNTQQQIDQNQLTTSQNMEMGGENFGHLIGTKVSFNLSPKLKLEIRPQLVLSTDRIDQLYRINSSSTNGGLLNTSVNDQDNRTNGRAYTQWIRLYTTFEKKGRSLDMFNVTTIDNNKGQLKNVIENVFYQGNTSTDINQLRANQANDFRNIFNATYSDLIRPNLTFNATANSRIAQNRNDIFSYLPNTNGEYVVPIDSLTEDFTRLSFRSEMSGGLRWKIDKLVISPQLSLHNFNAKNSFSNSPAIHQNYFFVFPSLNLSYDIFNLSLNGNYNEPTVANLQPVVNNTNSLFIRYGNPLLKPSLNYTASLGARKYDTKRFITYNFSINVSKIDNATVISRTVDQSGVQTTMPVNANGAWSVGNVISFQKDWKLTNNRQVSFLLSNNSNLTNTIALFNAVRSGYKIWSVQPRTEVRVNLNDKFEFNQSYGLNYYNSKYESTQFTDQSVAYHDSKSEVIFRFANHFVLESTLDYRNQPNSAPGVLNSFYRWNAAFTYIFLKGNRGQLKFAVNDILDQNIIATRSVRENIIEDVQGSTLRRFGLVTFTYNIRDFGEKVGGRNQLFRF